MLKPGRVSFSDEKDQELFEKIDAIFRDAEELFLQPSIYDEGISDGEFAIKSVAFFEARLDWASGRIEQIDGAKPFGWAMWKHCHRVAMAKLGRDKNGKPLKKEGEA